MNAWKVSKENVCMEEFKMLYKEFSKYGCDVGRTITFRRKSDNKLIHVHPLTEDQYYNHPHIRKGIPYSFYLESWNDSKSLIPIMYELGIFV